MNVYWDTSAIVKRYLAEAGSSAVVNLLRQDPVSGTVVVTRAEMAGVFSRAFSRAKITENQLNQGMRNFRQHWPAFLRIRITEPMIRDADHLAIEYNLRGYDAVHLAGALIWKDRVADTILFATFDDNLWRAAVAEGFEPFPERLPSRVLAGKR